MMGKNIGEPIRIKYARGSGTSIRTNTVTLELLERPLPDGRKLIQNLFQMDISELNNEVAQKYGFDRAYPVLIIVDTESRGMADMTGLRSDNFSSARLHSKIEKASPAS